MSAPKPGPIARAQAAWGDAIPGEVTALAAACQAQTASAVARRLGYSDAVVSHVLAAKYPGDLGKVFSAIRGLLMGETVDCPENGEMRRDLCLRLQAKPFNPSNSASARQYYACRGCEFRQHKDVA